MKAATRAASRTPHQAIPGTLDEALTTAAQAYLRKTISEARTLQEAAARAGYSLGHFSRVLLYFGVTRQRAKRGQWDRSIPGECPSQIKQGDIK